MSRHSMTLWCALALGGAAHAQVLQDGNFDALSVGTAPDNNAPAGAWQFPANYVAVSLGEVDPSNFSIVATSSFATGPGNSLAFDITSPTANVHLTNLLTSVINEAPGLVVRVSFRIWVAQAGAGGGAVYIGADMGGGGFSNALDRGPQLAWFPDGTVQYTIVGAVNSILVPAYPVGQWQQVQLDIKLDTDTFDAWWAPAGQPLAQVGTGLGFRSGTLNKLDRFSFAHFGATINQNRSFFDEISVVVLATCYPDCNGDGALNLADFGCFQTKFALGDPYADCNGDNVLNLADFGCFQTRFALGCP